MMAPTNASLSPRDLKAKKALGAPQKGPATSAAAAESESGAGWRKNTSTPAGAQGRGWLGRSGGQCVHFGVRFLSLLSCGRVVRSLAVLRRLVGHDWSSAIAAILQP
jgi:hypothetical protein